MMDETSESMEKTKTKVACYLRVSSDEQREKQTIQTQEDILRRYLDLNDQLHAWAWLKDDGVSGTIPMEDRPAGAELIALARAGAIKEIVVTRMDRLGRDSLDLLQLRQRLDRLGVKITAVLENVDDPLSYELRAVIAADERRRFLARSKEGMARAAREGRFCGGIVPMGYRVEGKKQNARLVPDEEPFWGHWSPAGLVRQMYEWLSDGWSCVKIAHHLNSLGVPTSYVAANRLLRDRTGQRTKRTQGRWRAGRIRNLVVNPVYKGEYHYGRRSDHDRDVIVSEVEALVSPGLWTAAQEALKANRLMTKNPGLIYILRSLMRCTICGLSLVGTPGRDGLVWYRCNGQIVGRGHIEGRCPSRAIRGDWIEPIVVADVTGWLENPGKIVEQLREQCLTTGPAAVRAAERVLVEEALAKVPGQRNSFLEAFKREVITLDDLQAELEKIKAEEAYLKGRLAQLTAAPEPGADQLPADRVTEIRARVRQGLDPVTWREVLSYLVAGIEVHTEVLGPRTKRLSITIHYRFPGVVDDDTGTGASQNYTRLQRVLVL